MCVFANLEVGSGLLRAGFGFVEWGVHVEIFGGWGEMRALSVGWGALREQNYLKGNVRSFS